MSGSLSQAPGTQRDAEGASCQTSLGKPPIVSSTSFFLAGKIREATGPGGVDLDQLVASIHFDLKHAAIAPASEFETPAQLVKEYGSIYLHPLTAEQALIAAQAYFEEVDLARAEGRYFGRNSRVLAQQYPNEEKAVEAFLAL